MKNSGAANVAYDSYYHQQCDRITNVNPFAYEKVALLNRNQQYNIYNDSNLF